MTIALIIILTVFIVLLVCNMVVVYLDYTTPRLDNEKRFMEFVESQHKMNRELLGLHELGNKWNLIQQDTNKLQLTFNKNQIKLNDILMGNNNGHSNNKIK